MNIQALVFDLDGTAIPLQLNGMPSKRVIAGFKVAMGNAADELKKVADWIAPSVDDDGLAIAIEKYIFHDTMS